MADLGFVKNKDLVKTLTTFNVGGVRDLVLAARDWSKASAQLPDEKTHQGLDTVQRPLTPLKIFIRGDRGSTEVQNKVFTIGILLTHENDPLNVLSGYLTFICLFNDGLFEDIQTTMRPYGYNVVKVIVDEDTNMGAYIAVADTELQKVLEELYSLEEVEDKDPVFCVVPGIKPQCLPDPNLRDGYCYAYMGVIMLLAVKQLTTESHAKWCQNRWRGLCNVARVAHDKEMLYTNLPSLVSCNAIHLEVSNMPALRRLIFNQLIVEASDVGTVGRICSAVLNLCRCAEMTHIDLIHRYILIEHPTLLCYPPIRPDLERFREAVVELAQSTFHLRPFLKLTLTERKASFLNRNRFSTLTAIAYRIGSLTQTTLKSYRGGETDQGGKKAEDAVKWLNAVEGAAQNGDEDAQLLMATGAQRSKVLSGITSGLGAPEDEEQVA